MSIDLIEEIDIYKRAKENVGRIDDKMLLWLLRSTVLLDVPVFSYQFALVDELEDRLYPEYDGDKVRLEDFGWSTPEGLIIYSDVFCTDASHRTKDTMHQEPNCCKCPYCFRHFKTEFYKGHPEQCSRRPQGEKDGDSNR